MTSRHVVIEVVVIVVVVVVTVTAIFSQRPASGSRSVRQRPRRHRQVFCREGEKVHESEIKDQDFVVIYVKQKNQDSKFTLLP